MRASLYFHLPEEEPEYLHAVFGGDAFCVIHRIKEELIAAVNDDKIPDHATSPKEYAEYMLAFVLDTIKDYDLENKVSI